MRRFSSIFDGLSQGILPLFKNLRQNLQKAGMRISPIEYISDSIIMGFGAMIVEVAFYIVLIYSRKEFGQYAAEAAVVAILSGIAIFFFLMLVPGTRAYRRSRDVEKDLLFALKTIVLHVKAGVPLYGALGNIALGDYGVVSDELRRVIHDVESGKDVDESLEMAAKRTNSKLMKRTYWQLINSMRSGTDVEEVSRILEDDLIAQHKDRIQKYGSDLRFLTVSYQMAGVIFPALAFIMLVIISLITGAEIPETLIIAMIVVFVLVEYFIVGYAKVKRPTVRVKHG